MRLHQTRMASGERAAAEEAEAARADRGRAPIVPQEWNAHRQVPTSVARALATTGRPLAVAHRADMERRFNVDLSGVRVHTDTAADQSARDLRARAYTVGTHIVFRAGRFEPASSQGRQLLAHELTHVVQQKSSGVPEVQTAIEPEDVSSEMVGKPFELSRDYTASGTNWPKGTRVMVMTWDNTSEEVLVTGLEPLFLGLLFPRYFTVPKTILRPAPPSGTRLSPYSAGIEAQAKAVEQNKAAADAAKGAEKTRLEGLLVTRRKVLNRKLIQETMWNRFDPIIEREVDAANAAHGFTGADALDPNLVKSMLFQESEIGTAGTHLEEPATHPVKTRFNLGQVIDSSGMALLTLMEREQPALMTTFALGSLRSDLSAAQNEKAALEKKKTLSATEQTRLTELGALSKQSWEVFIWAYRQTGATVGFADAVAALFGTSTAAKNLDYEFWIHMAVMWLFEKKRSGKSWLDAIRAYNGSGKRAEHYRDAVSKRSTDAMAAGAAGKPFIPTR